MLERRAIAGLLLLVAAGAYAGCGKDSVPSSTPAQQVQAAYRQYVRALDSERWADACRLMTVEARAGALVGAALLGDTPGSCVAAVRALAAEAPKGGRRSKLTSIRVAKGRATAGDGENSLSFARVNGMWLIDLDGEPAERGGTDTCDKLGIDRVHRREGRCVENGVNLTVVNPGRTAAIRDLRASYRGYRTLGEVRDPYSDPIVPEGVFVAAALRLENAGSEEATYSFRLALDGAEYTPAREASLAASAKVSDPLGPGLRRNVWVLFDVPPSRVAEMGRTGNVAVLVDGNDRDIAVLRTYDSKPS